MNVFDPDVFATRMWLATEILGLQVRDAVAASRIDRLQLSPCDCRLSRRI